MNVNAVGPCDFATPMIADALDEPEYHDWILDAIRAGRVGQPPEIVGAVLFLASPAAAMVAGHTLMVDGGRIAILFVPRRLKPGARQARERRLTRHLRGRREVRRRACSVHAARRGVAQSEADLLALELGVEHLVA